MKAIFQGYYRPSDDEIKSLWKTSVIILDTNVLLNFYRYSEEVKRDFQKVLEKVSDRLWVPYHAALEYQRNRLSVIAEQNKRFDQVKEVIQEAHSTLASQLEELQLKKRHSSINADPFVAKVKHACHEFSEQLDQIRKSQLQVHQEDKIRLALDQLLAEKIGPPPTDQKYLDQLYADGEIRYKALIPPGYMDESKSGREINSFSYNGLNYKRAFGDLILWKQILAYAKDKKPKGIIFVTDDKKEDWWWQIDALGKKTIGPRPELIDEMLRTAKTQFLMYSSESLMVNSREFLDVQVRKESIDQIRDVSEVIKQPTASSAKELAIEAVADWCKTAYPDHTHFEAMIDGPDFVIMRGNESPIGFDVKQMGTGILSGVLVRKMQWNQGIYNLAVVVKANAHPEYTKLIAQSMAKRVITGKGFYDNVFIGRIKQPNIFVPEWKVSKDGLQRMVYGIDTL